jgi:hypothetical protein
MHAMRRAVASQELLIVKMFIRAFIESFLHRLGFTSIDALTVARLDTKSHRCQL